ncbi:T3SS effector NleG family protein [Escherichia albertii]|uniref:T3SS effector NleG family protein n=1 Tax=Escherichia albertii TaxID=208962 RepID=UPI0016AE3FD4|nr:T3SS effector NleG family protein [Escherichia albertii]MCE7711556.1 T3SS effector NleG family protein [Escherichia albertii]MCZ7512350.1 T3SS effector NleG family protein [Escherichia albertii]MCZ8860081.1 T3SS effector NleG family protein [Escherichia albertii]
MPGLVSYISSTPFANEMAELRQQVMEGQIGGFLLGGERVRISYISDTGRFLAESEGQGQVYAELLNIGFNDGVDALRNRMLSVLSGMGGGQRQGNSLQEKISEYTFAVDFEKLHCPGDALQCPITLEQPEKGIFVKNSDDSEICILFDAGAFSRLAGEGSPHPLTREPITASIIVKPEECIYDSTRGNFVIKDT